MLSKWRQFTPGQRLGSTARIPKQTKEANMKVIDLFCGAGGLSSGLQQAGLEIVAGVDQDKDSMDTFTYSHAKSIAICKDVVSAVDDELKDLEKNHSSRMLFY